MTEDRRRPLLDRWLDRLGRTGNFLTAVLVACAKHRRRRPAETDPALVAAAERGRADALADMAAGGPGATHDPSVPDPTDWMADDEAEAYSQAYIDAAPDEWFPGRVGRLARLRRRQR